MGTHPSEITGEIARRRTFAIISHPDAGKTTLTEKLLLFGGAIQLAGEVKARGERRRARSDWMAIERERGISVSSAVMTFEHQGLVFNLLDKRYGFDALFLALVGFSDKAARLAFWIDSQVVDRIFVDGWGLLMRIWAELSNLFDALFIDRTVDGFGGLSVDLGVGLRSLVAEGQVQQYLMYIAIAVSLFAAMLMF